MPERGPTIQRKVSSRGSIQVARQHVQVGMTHAGKTFGPDLVIVSGLFGFVPSIYGHWTEVTSIPRRPNGQQQPRSSPESSSITPGWNPT